MTPWALADDQLLEIAALFAARVRQGLAGDGMEIRALLTFVGGSLPAQERQTVAVDLGGTRIRAALAEVGPGGGRLVGEPATALLPVTRGRPLPRDRFLAAQADLVASLRPPPGLPLGYCFSYPAAPLPDGDARLICWTKEVVVPDCVGAPIGALLLTALRERGVDCHHVAVVNDTVAALLAGLSQRRQAGHVGLIVGTGTNMAVLLPVEAIPKFPAGVPHTGLVPINLESGNFHPPHLTDWDEAVDGASENPGGQRFEKAVSGVYLSRLLAAAEPDLAVPVDRGAELLTELASHPGQPGSGTAAAILTRSARLVAAALCGLLPLAAEEGVVQIAAEGGLLYRAPGYLRELHDTLTRLLPRATPRKLSFELAAVPHASLLGAALAAARW